MGRLIGKVVLVTGAARGQGRSHAVRLAEEGAAIIAVDACTAPSTIPYPGATPEDLDQTLARVRAAGGSAIGKIADVRDIDQLRDAVDAGVNHFGRLDSAVANAGIYSIGRSTELSEESWAEMIDINLTGVWRTARVAMPHILATGQGGSIVITSSVAGLRGAPNSVHYCAAKHGLVGVMRTLALEYAKYSVRVNSIHPTTVDTDMVHNRALYKLFVPGKSDPDREDFAGVCRTMHPMPTPWVDARDVSNAVLFLVSDEARFITGVALPVDAGLTLA
jgi:(+)-trans-carveol dehydrogenase